MYECVSLDRGTRWNAYVSYDPSLPSRSMSQKTVHAPTEVAAHQKANDLLAEWKAQVDALEKIGVSASPQPTKKWNRKKYVGVQSVARSKRATT